MQYLITTGAPETRQLGMVAGDEFDFLEPVVGLPAGATLLQAAMTLARADGTVVATFVVIGTAGSNGVIQAPTSLAPQVQITAATGVSRGWLSSGVAAERLSGDVRVWVQHAGESVPRTRTLLKFVLNVEVPVTTSDTLLTALVPAVVLTAPADGAALAQGATLQATAVVTNYAGAVLTFAAVSGTGATISSSGLITPAAGGGAFSYRAVATLGGVAIYSAARSITAAGMPASVQVFDGNSLWDASFGASNGNTGPALPARAMALVGSGARPFSNFAVSGQTIDQMAADAATQIDTLVDPAKVNVIAVWELTNQLWNITPTPTAAAVGTAMKNYVAARYAAGWDRVVCGTMLPRQGETGARETARLAINADIRANPTLYGDVIWDVAGDSAWPDAPTYSASGFTNDTIHLNDAGNARVAPALGAAISQATLLGKRTAGATIDTVTITSPAASASETAGATVPVTASVTLGGAAVTGATQTLIITAGTGATASGLSLVGSNAGGSVTFKIRATKGATIVDSPTVTVTFAAVGGSTLASRLATLVTALGGDSNVAAIYHTGIAGSLTTAGGRVTVLSDARGAGHGPDLVAATAGGPTWDAGTGLMTGSSADARGLLSASSALFRRSAALGLAIVHSNVSGNTTSGFAAGITDSDGGTTSYVTVQAVVGSGSTYRATNQSGDAVSTVPVSTTPRLIIAEQAAGRGAVTIPNATTVTNGSGALGTGTAADTGRLKLFGFSDANGDAGVSNFAVVVLSTLTTTQVNALRDFAVADCGAVSF